MSRQSLQEQWQTLGAELRLLNVEPLSEETLYFLKNTSPYAPSFADAMPIIVAEFKQAAYEEIYTHTHQLKDSFHLHWNPKGSSTQMLKGMDVEIRAEIFALCAQYHKDMNSINEFLFQSPLDKYVKGDIGYITTRLIAYPHADHTESGLIRPFYLTRPLSLPVAVIPGKRISQADSSTKKLIQHACLNCDPRIIPTQLTNIYTHIPLRKVAMLLTARKPLAGWGLSTPGTVHWSGDVPQEGIHSLLFKVGSLDIDFPEP